MAEERVLIVGLNYAPEEVGIGPFTRGMAEGLAARGFAVHAVVGKPYYPQWRRHAAFARFGWQKAQEGGVSLVRCPHYVPATPTGARRLLHLMSFALSALVPSLRAALSQRPGTVICVAPALFSVPVAWLAARLAGARLWVHVQDFELEAALATGLVRQGLLARLARRFEAMLLRSADRVSTISPQMVARLVAKGVPPERAVEVRNWANAPAIDPAGAEAYRAEWALGERKVALYAGNIANKQGIEILVEAARRLANRDDLVFVICGEGPNRANLQALATGLTNVQFHDLQPAGRMGGLLALAHVHLLPQIAGAADLVLPSKLANMLHSGRPVVATALPGTGIHAEIDGCGVAVPPGDAEAVAGAIAGLLDDPERADRLGAEAVSRAAERWSQAAILDRLSAALRGLGR